MQDFRKLSLSLCANIYRRQSMAIIAGATLAVTSSAFAVTTVDITGLNGWTNTGSGSNATAPIDVSDAASFSGNASLAFGTQYNTDGWYAPTNGSFAPVTGGTVTISAMIDLPATGNPANDPSIAISGDNGVDQTFFSAVYNGTTTGWELLQTVIDLDAGTYVTTLNGTQIDPALPPGGPGGAGTYSTDAPPASLTEIEFYAGEALNGDVGGPFYVDNVSVVSSLDGTVFSDNFDSYIAVPEPASLSLLGLAGAALMGRRRRKA